MANDSFNRTDEEFITVPSRDIREKDIMNSLRFNG
jgi:hypothetical protein